MGLKVKVNGAFVEVGGGSSEAVTDSVSVAPSTPTGATSADTVSIPTTTDAAPLVVLTPP